MMHLSQLISAFNPLSVSGNTQQVVAGLCLSSANAKPGFMFFALKGTRVDGHSFIPQAIANGATVVVHQSEITAEVGITYIKVADVSVALGYVSSAFFGHPSQRLKLIAVTGTNGKTTTATLMFGLFKKMGYRCGLLSTVKNCIEDREISATHTTPDAISLNGLLAEMAKQGCSHVFMEASSHAIDQNRVAGIEFSGAIFTNITHDHLDYHHTFSNYIQAKKKLFDNLSERAWALTNTDDKNGQVMLQNTKASRFTYSMTNAADFKARVTECDFNGLQLTIDGEEAFFRLIGKFNAYNLLAVYASAILCGEDKHRIITTLSSLPTVSGRFETIYSSGKITGIVDYAHTPDALANVLKTINEIRTHNEQLVTVVGCGGNRDEAKRPVMAGIAAEYSNKVILTSDNPRNEDPLAIIEQMAAGVPAQHFKKVLKHADRAEAIKLAVSLSKAGDIILLAGKGHENYQEITGKRYQFDDRTVLSETFNLLEK